MRTRLRLLLKGLDKFYSLLPVRDDKELAFNPVLFESPADQTGIRGIIFGEKNQDRLFATVRLPGLRRAGS